MTRTDIKEHPIITRANRCGGQNNGVDHKFSAALTSQPVTPGPTMPDARTVAPCTPRTTSGAMISNPPPISTKALNPNTLGFVSGSHVPLAYASQRISLVAISQPVGPVKVTDALATPKHVRVVDANGEAREVVDLEPGAQTPLVLQARFPEGVPAVAEIYMVLTQTIAQDGREPVEGSLGVRVSVPA